MILVYLTNSTITTISHKSQIFLDSISSLFTISHSFNKNISDSYVLCVNHPQLLNRVDHVFTQPQLVIFDSLNNILPPTDHSFDIILSDRILSSDQFNIINPYTQFYKLINLIFNSCFSYTFIYPPTLAWSYMFQRPQQLFRALTSNNNIQGIYIDPSIKTFKYLRPNLLLINLNLFRQLFQDNKSDFILGISILYFTMPSHYFFINLFNPDISLFDMVDLDDNEFSFWQTDINNATSSANRITTTSSVIKNKLNSVYHVDATLISNGVCLSDFNQPSYNLPDDLATIKHQHPIIIGFHGAIASWLDYKLIDHIASKYHVVLIGDIIHSLDHLTNLSNISLLGCKKYFELPNYLHYFDVAIIPFLLTPMTHAIDPCKFYEYCAISYHKNLPICSTRLNSLITSESAKTCHFFDYNTCLDIIGRALINFDINEEQYIINRRLVAKKNSWLSKANHLLNYLNF